MANLTMHNIKLQGQVLLGSLPSNPAYHATSAPNGSMWFNSTTGKLMMMVAGSAAVVGDNADITALTAALAAYEASNDAALAAETARASAAEAAVQADVDQNEADADAGFVSATTDRAAIRTEFAAADAAEVVARNTAISTAVANLIDSAPGALDTLNELAAAIGDDANYAATMTNTIATLQADVDQNESDADAAIAALQADVDGNELDGDNDRALIRSQFAAADAVLKGDAAAAYDTLGKLEDKIQAEAVTARAAEVANAAAVTAEAATARAAEAANASAIAAVSARFLTVNDGGAGSYDASGDYSVQLTHSLGDSSPFVQVMVGGEMMMAPVTFDNANQVTVSLKGTALAAVGTVLVNFFSVA